MHSARNRKRISLLSFVVLFGAMAVTPLAWSQSQSSGNEHAGAGADTASNPASNAVDIVRDPSDVAPPIGNREPQIVKVSLVAQELEGKLDPSADSTYKYWTFNGKVPGPMIRVRQSDTVEVTLKNEGHIASHSVDLHAALGPGGGMELTNAAQGESKTFTFKAIVPGVFVYHCGTDLAAQHIANGMYGLIVVEPAGGLPRVDREFYVVQGEIYTVDALGGHGHQRMSVPKLMNERPEYFVFNGAVGALTEQHPMHAKVGESIRIFFGVGGPNQISSPHVIGQILERVYNEGSFTSPPLTSVQTTVVPPGGATVFEIKPQEPGTYKLTDHALIRIARGLVAVIEVTGPANPELFHAGPAQ